MAGILTQRLAVEGCDKLPHLAVGATATAAGGKKCGLEPSISTMFRFVLEHAEDKIFEPGPEVSPQIKV